jgi:hypothetical protein
VYNIERFTVRGPTELLIGGDLATAAPPGYTRSIARLTPASQGSSGVDSAGCLPDGSVTEQPASCCHMGRVQCNGMSWTGKYVCNSSKGDVSCP